MKKFEHELDLLRERVAQMGDLAEAMVAQAIQILSEPEDDSPTGQILREEDQVDRMQLDIDHEAIRLLTVYSPVAANLRMIFAVSRINSELERIADQALNLCNHVQFMVSQTEATPLPQFKEMAKVAKGMIHDMLKAFRLDDSRLAKDVMANDDLIDTMHDQILRDLLGGKRPRTATPAADDVAEALSQILISHSLERMADHVCNACEQIVYIVEGADIRHSGKGG